MSEGIRKLHSRSCAARAGGRCNCGAGYEAAVFSAREGKKIRKTFPTLAAARAWRADASGSVRRGALRASRPRTIREAGKDLIDGMRSGMIRTRSGDEYKPSVIRSYEASLRLHIEPELGPLKLQDVQRRDVQALADRMLGNEKDPSTIRNALLPLRVIFRRALEDGDLAINPCAGVRLPAVRGRRDRIVSAEQAANLIATLPKPDRAIWSLALYAGLRRGELMALRWKDVDLANGVVRVDRSWDAKEGPVKPKSRAGQRRVPIPGVLRDILAEHKLDANHELVLARPDGTPFDSGTVTARARRVWKEAKLEALTLHEARHTFASLMIAAGVNARALCEYMGHASVTITYDRYGHLMPGNENEAAELLDSYLERADTRSRLASLDAASDSGRA